MEQENHEAPRRSTRWLAEITTPAWCSEANRTNLGQFTVQVEDVKMADETARRGPLEWELSCVR